MTTTKAKHAPAKEDNVPETESTIEAPVATKKPQKIKEQSELILEAIAEEMGLDSNSLIERYQDKVAVGQAVENHDNRPSTL